MQTTSNLIVIIDFGSQTTHLISRRIRDLGVDSIVIEPDQALSFIKEQQEQVKGIVLSGGPSFVQESASPQIDSELFSLSLPILGICYGWQLTAHLLGGKVISGHHEYGPTEIEINNPGNLFDGIDQEKFTVWMSHGDEVVVLPDGFSYQASSAHVKAAAVANIERKIYGVQFHPEVEHTQHGQQMIKNFLEKVCGLQTQVRTIDVNQVIAEVREKVNQMGANVKAIAAISGGVDSTVASAIVAKAIGDRFIPLYCENGLMRVGTREEVQHIFNDLLHIKPVILDCEDEFLAALKGVTDPEQKRQRIGKLYIDLFEKAALQEDNITFLVQGTIYSDVIESRGSKHASKIKSHHNVGGLPENMKLQLLEPLRHFYKDEVRILGRQLGLPEEVLMKHPFPGPGQAIRILGEVTKDRLMKQQQADQIVLEVLKRTGWYGKVFQGFPVMTGVKTTAVKGDGRLYGELVGLRIYDGSEIMTAGWTHLPYEILQEISTRIVNEVEDVSRVAYDITTKPPATMEWE